MKTLAAIFGFLLIAAGASAQHGTAPSGYYPIGYTGDTWTGVVVSVNPNTGEFVLTYTRGSKTESFTGVPEDGYMVLPKDSPLRPLKPGDIHVGRIITVFYMAETKKVDGKKVVINTVVNINSIPNNKKGTMIFKAFG